LQAPPFDQSQNTLFLHAIPSAYISIRNRST
jgi:hypothetical protein